MACGEFELIAKYFSDLGAKRSDVLLGVGDDGTVLAPPAGQALVAVVDTLVEGVHFPRGASPESIGHRAFAVNLSDLAAMGAEPAWALLALTLPSSDETWLKGFAVGAGAIANAHQVALVGGDTTSGPLAISVQLLGFAPAGAAIRRSGAQPGDAICVSGTVGDAAAGLAIAQARLSIVDGTIRDRLLARFEYPQPRCQLGTALRSVASACIDVSDGLGGDLVKLCAASGVSAEIETNALPLSAALLAAVDRKKAEEFALTGGDDYELCFTVPPTRFPLLAELAREHECGVTRIGTVVGRPPGEQSVVRLRNGATVTQFSHRGFDHFRAEQEFD
jgi:thiamine-monophosphate kinase